MRLRRTVQIPVWVVLPIIVVIIIGGIVISQMGQQQAGDDMTPVGDQGVQASPDDTPRSAGGMVSGNEGLVAWAEAAAVGDYVTAQQHMEEDALLYAVWKDHHDTFVASITGFRVLHTETAGQTTTARVQFDANDGKGPRCMTVQLNAQTQKVRADRVYGPCP